MQTALRRRTTWAIAASVLAHVGVLAVAVAQRHNLALPPEEASGPPTPVIPVLLMPRTPPNAAGGPTPPGAVRLHRRPQRLDDSGPPAVTPLITPPTPKLAEAPAPAPASAPPKAPQPSPAPTDAVRATLRTTLDCAEAQMARMGRDERASCLERLGRGAHDAPYLASALSPDKRALLDEIGAAKLARKFADEHPFAGTTAQTGRAEPQDYSGEPDVATNAVPAHSHPPSKRAAKVLPPLRP